MYDKATALSGDCGSPSPMNKHPLAAGPHGDSPYGKHSAVLKFLSQGAQRDILIALSLPLVPRNLASSYFLGK